MKQLLLLLFLCTPILSSQSATSSTGNARRKSPAEILTILRNFKADSALQFKTTVKDDDENSKKIKAFIIKNGKEKRLATIRYLASSNSKSKITSLTKKMSFKDTVIPLIENACSALLCMALLDCLKIAGNDTPCHFYPGLFVNFPTNEDSEPSGVLYYNSQCTEKELDPWICLAETPKAAPLYHELLIQRANKAYEADTSMFRGWSSLL